MTHHHTLHLRLRLAALLAVSALSLVLVACGRDRSGGSCTPGATVPCVCAGGGGGSRTCSTGGSYGECQCGGMMGDGGTSGDSGVSGDGGTMDTDGGGGTGACPASSAETLNAALSNCLSTCAFMTEFDACFASCFSSSVADVPPACASCYTTNASCTHEYCVSVEACAPTDLAGCVACECGDNDGLVDCLTPFVACSGTSAFTCTPDP